MKHLLTNMEINTPKISVIVPVYNVEQYLPKCIESILTQTFTDYELLLINDGSSDNSGRICEKYAQNDSHIHVFHKANGGVSSARNFGIDKALGEWICFVDSDDWIDEETFYGIMNVIDNKNIDLVIWGMKIINKTHTESISVPQSGLKNIKDEIYEILIKCDLRGYFGSPCTKLFKNKLIRSKGIYFDTRLSIMEDSKFNYAYFENVNSIISINNLYYNYRQGHNSKSLSNKFPDDFISLWKDHIKMRSTFYSPYIGKYKDLFKLKLEKELQTSYLTLIFSLYNQKVSSKSRREEIDKYLRIGNIEAFKDDGYIYLILKSKNKYVIDFLFKIRHLIYKYSPYKLLQFARYINIFIKAN